MKDHTIQHKYLMLLNNRIKFFNKYS